MSKEKETCIPVRNVLCLIRHHFDNDELKFKDDCYEISQILYKIGKDELASYVAAYLSDSASFVPMENQK